MFTGFIFEDYKMKVSDLTQDEIQSYCNSGEYTSIDMNDYYIFISNKLNKEELYSKPHPYHLNEELLRMVNILK